MSRSSLAWYPEIAVCLSLHTVKRATQALARSAFGDGLRSREINREDTSRTSKFAARDLNLPDVSGRGYAGELLSKKLRLMGCKKRMRLWVQSKWRMGRPFANERNMERVNRLEDMNTS
jgi:sugar lactone lactonase YvrE